MIRTCLLLLAFWFALFVLTSFALAGRPNHPPAAQTVAPSPTIGSPLFGLTPSQLQSFSVGRAQFQVAEAPADGLGPLFNAQSCFACHTQPVTSSGSTPGGASAFTETRAAKLNADGSFNSLSSEDGTLFKLSSLTPASQEIVPADATLVAHRKTTPLFGSGLIEAIPDSVIIANANLPKGDGVSGRVATLNDSVTNMVAMTSGPNNHVGRFGWKDQEATLTAFAGDAYLNEMGITNRFFTTDLAPNGDQARLADAEPPPLTPTTLQDPTENPALPENPVTNLDDVDQFANFMKFLAPPPTVPLTASALNGKVLFTSLNCVACHTPSMTTGPSSVVALAFKPVALYSDLLLHKVGTGDGIAQAAAKANELRTPPLWGLRFRSPFLHDGSAQTVKSAIERHGSEAQTIEKRFDQLSSSQKDDLLAFLNSI